MDNAVSSLLHIRANLVHHVDALGHRIRAKHHRELRSSFLENIGSAARMLRLCDWNFVLHQDFRNLNDADSHLVQVLISTVGVADERLKESVKLLSLFFESGSQARFDDFGQSLTSVTVGVDVGVVC